MSLLRRFEKRLEKIFEEPFARVFKGAVHPLELGKRLLREIDDGKMVSMGEVLAPNVYHVHLHPADFRRLEGYLQDLSLELEGLVINHVNDKGYQLLTRPRVTFGPDDDLHEGEFIIDAVVEKGGRSQPPTKRIPSGGGKEERETRLGMLTVLGGEQAGLSYTLKERITRIGRAGGNDIVLADPKTSRFHAEIEHVPEGYVIRDLGSTNGTLVRGRRVEERLLEDGDVITLGETSIKFGLVSPPRRV